FAAREVAGEVPCVQRPERDTRHLSVHLLPGGGDQGQPRDDLVRLPGQALEHRLCVFLVLGLAVDAPAADHLRVAAEHGAIIDGWNSTPLQSSSSQSKRYMPFCGRCNRSVVLPWSGTQRMRRVVPRMKTSSPPGRSRRDASAIQSAGSHQIEAPYSEKTRSNDSSGSGTSSAFASISSSPRSNSSFRRRAVSSWAGVTSIPTTRLAPARLA